jgi:predicted DsbA family dithiol-disulfide isomerase
VGAVRLRDLEEELGDAITVEWRSYLLRPQPEPRTLEQFTRYTEGWERPAGLEPRARFQRWSGENPPPSHSVPPAVAGKVAQTFGPEAFEAFHLRLLEAYFAENRTVSDRDVLRAVAAESGLDPGEFDRRFDAGAMDLTGEVFIDHMTATQTGIQGVPAVIVGRSQLVSGAQDVAVYRSVRRWRRHEVPRRARHRRCRRSSTSARST